MFKLKNNIQNIILLIKHKAFMTFCNVPRDRQPTKTKFYNFTNRNANIEEQTLMQSKK